MGLQKIAIINHIFEVDNRRPDQNSLILNQYHFWSRFQ
jgi:hypothetical protein